MKRSSKWIFRSIGGKIMMGLVLAAMIASMDVVPSFSEDDHDRGGKHDDNRNERKARGHDRERHEQQGRRENRHYGYRERVYAPPPIVYEPPPAPGISIFLPPIIIRP
jgi:hypothetical protein